MVYGDKLKRVYPSKRTEDYLWIHGIKYAVVDVAEQSVTFLNNDGEIVDQIAKDMEVDNPGLSFKLNYFVHHVLYVREQ
jgi:hypothetical protein